MQSGVHQKSTLPTSLEVGEWIELYEKDDDKTVFYGIITKTSTSKENIYTYSGYDAGFYCEKNKVTKQFKTDTNISNAIAEVCKDVQIPCGNIVNIPYTLKKIYKNNTVSDILNELLEFAKQKGFKTPCYFDCKNGYVNLREYTENAELYGNKVYYIIPEILDSYDLTKYDYIR